MNEQAPNSGTRRLLSRRRMVLAAGVAAAAVLGWRAWKPRRIGCLLFPAAYQGSGGSHGVIGRETVFSDPPFAECHASTLAATGDGLVCCWFGGSREGQAAVGIWMSRRGSGGWSAPRRIVGGSGAEGQPLPCWNPVLWQQPGGSLYLFYKVGPSPRSWWGMLMRSPDGGASWGAARRLPDGILGPVKNKPLLLADGRLLCPSSTEHDGWRVHFEWTADEGRNWERTAPVGDGQTVEIIQPTVLAHGDRRLQALCRGRQRYVAETWSGDGGRSWSAPELTDLPNPNSGLDGLTLADGRHLLVHNPVPRRRAPLVVSLSEDGKTWREIATLAQGRGEFSYPAVIQGPDSTVHVSYTDRRQTIAHVTFDPGAI